MAGSIWPGRVPIGRPSSAVKPIVLSTLRPPESAHIEAPLPRCATTTRRLAIAGATHALGVERLRDRVMVGDGVVAAVERGVEARDLGQPRPVRPQRADRRQV